MNRHTFEVTGENFQAQVLDAAQPVLVEFGAEWCPPCKMIAPILNEIAESHAGQMRVGTLDVDAHPEIQLMFGVMGLPTMILFSGGAPVKRLIGYQPRQKIEAQIAPYLTTQEA